VEFLALMQRVSHKQYLRNQITIRRFATDYVIIITSHYYSPFCNKKNGFALARDLQHFLYEGRASAYLKIDLKIFYDISGFLTHQNRRSSKSKSLKSTRKENKAKKINK